MSRVDAADGRASVRLNLLSNIGLLALQAVLGLWFTSYLVRSLGVAVYGLVPLAASIAMYANVATNSVQIASRRVVALAMGDASDVSPSDAQSTALVGTVGMIAVLAPAILAVSYMAPTLFDVPAGYREASRYFFAMSLLGFLLVEARGVVSAPVFARNRLDILNSVRATDIVLRLALPVGFFTLVGKALEPIGAGVLAGGIISLALSAVAWRRISPEVVPRLRLFRASLLKSMLRTSGWLTANQVGTLLHATTDVIVLNVLIGAEVAGAYGTVLQWPTFLRALAVAVAGVLLPLVLAQHARGDEEALRRTTSAAVRLLGLGVALPTGLVVGLSGPLMVLWLGPGFEVLGPLLAVSVLHLGLNLAFIPVFSVEIALGRVRVPAIMMVLSGVLNIILSVLWVSLGDYGMGVAIATLIALTVNNAVFTPVYGARLLGLPAARLYRAAMPGVVGAIAIGLGSWAVSTIVPVESWIALVLVGSVFAAVYVAVAYRWGLRPDDRSMLMSTIRARPR